MNINELLEMKAECQARLNLIAYNGTPEIKTINNEKYLYVRKRELGKVRSTYVGVYSDELYNVLLLAQKDRRELNKKIREITKELVKLGYEFHELDNDVIQNINLARSNMKLNIYNQAVLEGVGTTFPQTEDIIENGIVNNVSSTDVQKILNLKHAWEFILDEDVILCPTDFSILSVIAKLVNEGFYADGGKVRVVPVSIGGTNYIPKIPDEIEIKENIFNIISSNDKDEIKAIKLALYVMKTQVFNDGNKRASIIFANHYLIKNGKGILVVPEDEVSNFKKLLINYYEGKDEKEIIDFMESKCVRKLT